MTQGQPFQPQVGSPGIQTVITTLQNIVLAINALTSTITTQFGASTVYQTSSLPSPGGTARAFVSDSTVAAVGNFGVPVLGGGTNTVPVYYDNTGWKIG